MSVPIEVLGLYEDAVATSPAGDAITSVVVRLSADPDEAWADAFEHEWARTDYPRKRSVRVGRVRATGGAVRRGLVLAASPADYVDKHKRHVEDAVARANGRVLRRAERRDATVAEAARTIRQINADHYGSGHGAGPDRSQDGGPGLRLAV